ncbi:hypothetical protein PFISCL1PPCAC_4545, partial [Pristionchus fissidentatus]
NDVLDSNSEIPHSARFGSYLQYHCEVVVLYITFIFTLFCAVNRMSIPNDCVAGHAVDHDVLIQKYYTCGILIAFFDSLIAFDEKNIDQQQEKDAE